MVGQSPLVEPLPLLRIRLPGPQAVELMLQARKLSTEADGPGDEHLGSYGGEQDVSPAQLRAAYVVMKHQGQSHENNFIETVMRGARSVYPRHTLHKEELALRAKKSEEWRRKLHHRHQQREYDRMVKNVYWGGGKKPDPETRPVYQASIAFNMLAATFTAGFLGWYAAGAFLSKYEQRLMVGIIAAMFMLVVEMTLYIIRTSEIERYAPKRERNVQMGQKGLRIPTGFQDDIQFWKDMSGGRKAKMIISEGVKQKVL